MPILTLHRAYQVAFRPSELAQFLHVYKKLEIATIKMVLKPLKLHAAELLKVPLLESRRATLLFTINLVCKVT